ncbi:MAG: peptidylprolyl isomerase [Rhodocyclaceae bacterium]|nr:peptidylprolyl isomerase [Rhodocyclaceae bacterium]
MKNPLTTRTLALCGLLMVASAQADDEALLAKSPEATVTVTDLQAELATVPADRMNALRAEPSVAARVVADIHLRRRLAKRAEDAGLPDDVVLRTRLKLLRERVLAEAYLQEMSERDITDEAVSKLAQSEYRAQPERFQRDPEVQVRHILLKANECEADRGLSKAEDLRQRVLNGEAFDALAMEFSQDPGSAPKGGDLGYVPRGRTVKPFEDAAFALESPGDVSEVVESQFGFHIIQLEAKRSAGLIPYPEVQAGLEQEIEARLQAAARKKLLEEALASDTPEYENERISATIDRLAKP